MKTFFKKERERALQYLDQEHNLQFQGSTYIFKDILFRVRISVNFFRDKSFRFHGGVHPYQGKRLSNTGTIHKGPLPDYLILSLAQGGGAAPIPVVKEGERVFKNQLLAKPSTWMSAAIHAPTSGIVEKIGMYPRAHVAGMDSPSIILKTDGKDEKNFALTVENHSKFANAHDFAVFLQENGIIGMGGAGFPTNGKVSEDLDEIVINAAECEPMISSDDLLMRERADEVIAGIAILAEYLKPKRTIIGIEDNKPEATAILQAAITKGGYDNIFIKSLPTLYPSGDAKHLAYLLTGKEIAASKRTTSKKVQVFNVGTAHSIYRALVLGEPLTSRIVTLTGNVERPGNYEVLIGTPIEDLMKFVGIKKTATGIIHGGPMMGFTVKNPAAPILKITNCLIATDNILFPQRPPEMPCIRCTECARHCPSELQPYALYWAARAKNLDAVKALNISECIECGCCSFMCPANIPHVHYFRYAKNAIRTKAAEQKAAEEARERFEFKEARLAREKEEKAEKLKKLAEAKKAAAEKTADSQKNNALTVEKSDSAPAPKEEQ